MGQPNLYRRLLNINSVELLHQRLEDLSMEKPIVANGSKKLDSLQELYIYTRACVRAHAPMELVGKKNIDNHESFICFMY